jgi:hypothetical protein
MAERVRIRQSAADFKSAIQQSSTLRYAVIAEAKPVYE